MKKAWIGVLCFLVLCGIGAWAAAETLTYGSTGDDVTALQEKLAALGYYSFRITGNYQENTQKAVREYQEDNGHIVTGIADDALQTEIASVYARPKPTPTPRPTMSPEERAVEYTQKLSYGSTGETVRLVQARLAELGYYHIDVSGNYLENTVSGVKEFQRLQGLSVDGIVGANTWAALFQDPSPVEAGATPRPTPEPTPVPYQIGVDVTNQVVTVYGHNGRGGYTDVVRRMICSTGTEKDPTPNGSYITNGATARWCYFPKWGTHAQYWTRIDAYNAFHSVIYGQANTMALKTSSYTGLGKRASHGCIRLMVEDAKWIYDNCGKGTEVIVYDGEPDEELAKSLKIPPLDKSVMLPEPTPGPTMSPYYETGMAIPMPSRKLEYGVEGEDVYWLQCRLAEMGYYGGSITGGYYAGTQQAVRDYQRDQGLSADGIAGTSTLQALYQATGEDAGQAILRVQQEVRGTLPPEYDILMPMPTPAPLVTPRPTDALDATAALSERERTWAQE